MTEGLEYQTGICGGEEHQRRQGLLQGPDVFLFLAGLDATAPNRNWCPDVPCQLPDGCPLAVNDAGQNPGHQRADNGRSQIELPARLAL